MATAHAPVRCKKYHLTQLDFFQIFDKCEYLFTFGTNSGGTVCKYAEMTLVVYSASHFS